MKHLVHLDYNTRKRVCQGVAVHMRVQLKSFLGKIYPIIQQNKQPLCLLKKLLNEDILR